MAPTATASARRAPAKPRSSAPRRPPLRLFEPAPRRRQSIRSARRPAVWASSLLIVGSLLAVVVGDALLTEGQVRLSSVQAEVASAAAAQKLLQVSVAQKTAPPVVVGLAESQGLVAPTQVVYLPQVPLNVPLPPPRTTPLPAPTAAPSSSRPGGSSVSPSPPSSPSASPTPSPSTASTASTSR
jgi:hypothetical protein